MNESPMLFAWKFLVPDDDWYCAGGIRQSEAVTDRELAWKGMTAVAVSATAEGARAAIEKYLVGDPGSPGIGWLKAARVIQLPLVEGAFLTMASV
mgnify:CR=1 FL=1